MLRWYVMGLTAPKVPQCSTGGMYITNTHQQNGSHLMGFILQIVIDGKSRLA